MGLRASPETLFSREAARSALAAEDRNSSRAGTPLPPGVLAEGPSRGRRKWGAGT